MKKCILIPGFAGSQLFLSKPRLELLWASKFNLSQGGFYALQLQEDGLSDMEYDRGPIIAGGFLPDYYQSFADTLRDGLLSSGYTVSQFGWDWRKDWRLAGQVLADSIEDEENTSAPFALVGHSAGGLVARWAYSLLKARGKASLIRRIVTICTPHRGSYAAVRLLSGDDPTLNEIESLGRKVRYLDYLGVNVVSVPATESQLTRIMATMPGSYYLLPVLDDQAATDDPQRAEVYDLDNWLPSRGLKNKWLQKAKNEISPWLANVAANAPPPWVMTCVCGYGFQTPDRLLDPQYLGTVAAYGSTATGDVQVTATSALLPGYPRFSYQANHSGILKEPELLDAIVGMVLDERGPSTPIPPPVVDPGPATALLNAMPFPGNVPVVTIDAQGGEVNSDNQFVITPSSSRYFPSSIGGRSVFHVSITYNQRCSGGRTAEWTENFWNNADAAKDALERGKRLADAMSGLHGATSYPTRIMATRVPGADGVAVSKESLPLDTGYTKNPGNTIGVSDFPTNALAEDVFGGGAKTLQWIKGIRDDFIDDGGFLKESLAQFSNGHAAFAAFITNAANGFVMRCLDTANKKIDVLSITSDGVFTTAAAHTLDIGLKVRVSGCQQNLYPNRVWRVASIPSTTTFTVAFWAPPTPFIPIKGHPTSRKQSYAFPVITKVSTRMATKKNVGSVKKGLSGKSKKKR